MDKKLVVTATLLLAVFITALTKPSSSGIDIPSCDIDSSADIRINFFVDQEILEHSSLDDVIESLENSVEYANQVLSNSCIPLTRSLGQVKPILIDKNKINNLDASRTLVKQALADQGIFVNEIKSTEKYGLVFDSKYANQLKISGKAFPYFGGWFFTLSSNAQIHILEHELGHLSWAQHGESHPLPNLSLYLKSAVPNQYHNKLASYARAFRCGDSGTVMSYEPNILPIYSSPTIRYQDVICGDEEAANNARVMREFAQNLIDSNLQQNYQKTTTQRISSAAHPL
jgi:hypothetical protein